MCGAPIKAVVLKCMDAAQEGGTPCLVLYK